ncbi:MAG: hypothetical protein F6J93_00815 [Oscillatoria sp. SIO1A7]|nr:hypothetical protein [Oscillatoria sp. SIO1A7]
MVKGDAVAPTFPIPIVYYTYLRTAIARSHNYPLHPLPICCQPSVAIAQLSVTSVTHLLPTIRCDRASVQQTTAILFENKSAIADPGRPRQSQKPGLLKNPGFLELFYLAKRDRPMPNAQCPILS